jgi:hypothetical protein
LSIEDYWLTWIGFTANAVKRTKTDHDDQAFMDDAFTTLVKVVVWKKRGHGRVIFSGRIN